MCLCFSPICDDLKRQCRDFSDLVSRTIINWFDPWPEKALSGVSKDFIEEKQDLIDSKYLQTNVSHM